MHNMYARKSLTLFKSLQRCGLMCLRIHFTGLYVHECALHSSFLRLLFRSACVHARVCACTHISEGGCLHSRNLRTMCMLTSCANSQVMRVPRFCRKHAPKFYVNVKNKICNSTGCTRQASYGEYWVGSLSAHANECACTQLACILSLTCFAPCAQSCSKLKFTHSDRVDVLDESGDTHSAIRIIPSFVFINASSIY
jgi:hypothetical protein